MAKYTEITVSSIDATGFKLPKANTDIRITARPTITINLVLPDGVFTKPIAGITKFHGASESEILLNIDSVETFPIEIHGLSGKINGTRIGGILEPFVILKKPMTYTPGMLARFIPDTCVAAKNFNITSKIIDDSFIENLVTRDKLELIMECGYQKIGSGITPQDCRRERETFKLPSEGDGSTDTSLVTGIEINHEPIHHAKGVVLKSGTANGSLANLLITYPGLGYQKDYPPIMEFYSMNRVTELSSAQFVSSSAYGENTITITMTAPNDNIELNQIVTGGNIGTTTPGTVYVNAINPGHDGSLIPIVEALVIIGNLGSVSGDTDGYRCHPESDTNDKGEAPPGTSVVGIGQQYIVVKIDVDTIGKIKPGLLNAAWTYVLPNQIANWANLADITARNTEVIVTCVSEKYTEVNIIGTENFKCTVGLTNTLTTAWLPTC